MEKLEKKTIEITSAEELATIINENNLVIVDYYANWCNPCRMLLPILEELANEFDSVKICKVNCDQNEELARTNQVRSLPTLMFYKNGENVNTKKGFVAKNDLIEIIENL